MWAGEMWFHAKPQMQVGGGHSDVSKPSSDLHSQIFCSGTSSPGTAGLRQQYLTDWSWHHWEKQTCPSVLAYQQHPPEWRASSNPGKARNWDHQYLLLKTIPPNSGPPSRVASLAYLGHQPICAGSPLARLHTLLGPGSFHPALMAMQCVSQLSLTVMLSSNTQTEQAKGEVCIFSKYCKFKYTTSDSWTHQAVHNKHTNSSNSEFHLHLDTSMSSVVCDDQDWQVLKLFHPGHPNLSHYNAWEDSNLPAVVVSHCGKHKPCHCPQEWQNIRGTFLVWGFFWGGRFVFFSVTVCCIFL